jgi:hypothetical protein
MPAMPPPTTRDVGLITAAGLAVLGEDALYTTGYDRLCFEGCHRFIGMHPGNLLSYRDHFHQIGI